MEDIWKNWDTRPQDGEHIYVRLFGDGKISGTYDALEGIDGVVIFDESCMEIEEYSDNSMWRSRDE